MLRSSTPKNIPLGMLTLFLFCGLLAGRCPAAEKTDASRSQPKRIVIVTGEDYKGHKWQETAPILQRALAADERLQVDVVTDLNFLRKAELQQYDGVVMHFKNYDPAVPGTEGYRKLEEFVRGGKGLVLVHFACGAFQEEPDFVKLAGRAWNPKLRGHDRYRKFQVNIADGKHLVTAGLEPFETEDELYTCLDGQTPITVLADAVSNVDHKTYPMAFVLDFGKGNVFHCLLGHNVAALDNAAVGELYRRGCAWTVGLDPNPSTQATSGGQQ